MTFRFLMISEDCGGFVSAVETNWKECFFFVFLHGQFWSMLFTNKTCNTIIYFIVI